MNTTRTTPGAISAEAILQALRDAVRQPHLNIVNRDCRWIIDRASEIESTRTPATQDAVAALDRMINACRNILAKQTIVANMAQRVEFWNAVEEAEALSAAHHARKPKEK